MSGWIYFRKQEHGRAEGPAFEAVRLVSGQRFNLNLEGALSLALGHVELPGHTPSEPGGERAACLTDRPFPGILPYYMASRRVNFADRSDGNRDIRRATLQSYLQESELPMPARFDDSELIPLDRGDLPEKPDGDITAGSLGRLLWFGCRQVRRERRAQASHGTDLARILRSFASGLDLVLIAQDVAGLSAGTYDYSFEQHALRKVAPPAAPHQSPRILLTTAFPRYQWRYRHERALRQLYIDGGRLAEFLLRAASASGLWSRLSYSVDARTTAAAIGRSPAESQVICAIDLEPR